MSHDWAAQAAGKTVASLEWSDEGEYWVMTFTDGSEICWSETMAEREAESARLVEAAARMRARVAAGEPCCSPGYFLSLDVPAGWAVGGRGGGALCGVCGAIWRLGADSQWRKEPAPHLLCENLGCDFELGHAGSHGGGGRAAGGGVVMLVAPTITAQGNLGGGGAGVREGLQFLVAPVAMGSVKVGNGGLGATAKAAQGIKVCPTCHREIAVSSTCPDCTYSDSY